MYVCDYYKSTYFKEVVKNVNNQAARGPKSSFYSI